MKAVFRKSFERDLRKIREASTKRRILESIENVEKASDLNEIPHWVKISGSDSFFRIRAGNYRLGIALSPHGVEFVRCLHRREIYRYFP